MNNTTLTIPAGGMYWVWSCLDENYLMHLHKGDLVMN